MVEAAVDPDIGQHEVLRIHGPGERNSQMLANRAVCPVTAEEPVGLDFFDPVAGGQSRGNARVVLRHRYQLGAALDPHPLPDEMLFEDPLGLVLRHAKNKGITRVEHTEFGMSDASALAVHVDARDAMTSAQEIVGEAHQLEGLHGSRMDRDRPRLHRTVRGLVDHATVYPIACEFVPTPWGRPRRSALWACCSYNPPAISPAEPISLPLNS